MNISLLFRSALFIGLLSSFAAAQEGAKKIPCGELLPKSFLSANFQGGISYAETSDDNNGKLASCRATIKNGTPGMLTGFSVTVWDKEAGYQLSLDRLTKSAEKKLAMIPIVSVTAKPWTGPVPKIKSRTEVMRVVACESMMAEKAR